MMNILRHLFFIICFILPSFYAHAATTTEEYSLIINLAGKQRMLTQKMVKEALLIFTGTGGEKNRQDLKNTVELFLKTLNGLRDGDNSLGLSRTTSQSIKTRIDVIKLEFNKVEFIFKRIIAGEMPSRDAIMEIAEKNLVILDIMDAVVGIYEQESREVAQKNKAFLGIEINISGKQRMLSQKMAKEALLIYVDIDSRKNKRALCKTYKHFDKALKGLKYGDGELGLPGTTEKNIAQQLDSVMKTWRKLEPIVERSCDIMVDKISREEIETISALSALLLNGMDKTVTMYENLGRR
ncbi:MAG: type IV pili methyl-accepting chemotaxis transducer N-terminal domain-containing protein [Omnitrophica bacterium]|nr:type IV pili methyl-accepting chemotaxis transducer N-terminal domain-containing protein [Candidatus Omnitrophota bacterium]